METITRKDAKAAGLKYYFTGKPCKRGHIDKRFVVSFTCMTCAREKAKEHWNQCGAEWKSRRSAYNKQRWQDPVVRERHREYARQDAKKTERHREWKKENREKLARKSREWYHANSEYALERQKAYTATRPIELRRFLGRRGANKRRAIKKQVFIEVVDARVVFERDSGICGICKLDVDKMSPWEVDHIVPISKGGLHAYVNVQLAHRKCNRSKAARVPA